MACEYPVCPCQRLCSFSGDFINPAESIYCHVHVHRDHAHIHVHADDDDKIMDVEVVTQIKDSHAHAYSKAVYRYIPFNASVEHWETWHDKDEPLSTSPAAIEERWQNRAHELADEYATREEFGPGERGLE